MVLVEVLERRPLPGEVVLLLLTTQGWSHHHSCHRTFGRFSSAYFINFLPRLNTSGMSNNYNGGGTNSSTWGPSSTGTSWLGKSPDVLSVLSSLPVPDSGGSGPGTTYGGGNSGGGGLGGLGGTSGPPSFNQGSTFTGGSSYGPSFAGDIIRKPSR